MFSDYKNKFTKNDRVKEIPFSFYSQNQCRTKNCNFRKKNNGMQNKIFLKFKEQLKKKYLVQNKKLKLR